MVHATDDTSLIHFAKLKNSVSKRLQHCKILLYDVLKGKTAGMPKDPWLPGTVDWGGRPGAGAPPCSPTALPHLLDCGRPSPWRSRPQGRRSRQHQIYEEGVPGSFVPPFRLPSHSPFLMWEMRTAHRGSGQTQVHDSSYPLPGEACAAHQGWGQEEKGGQHTREGGWAGMAPQQRWTNPQRLWFLSLRALASSLPQRQAGG